jgi:hypothetical protein
LLQVLRDVREGEACALRQLLHGSFALPQMLEQFEPVLVAQRPRHACYVGIEFSLRAVA